MHSNLKDEEDIMFSIYNISDWLTYVLFALFSSTYYVEFRRLDRLEMSCFQKHSPEKKPTERVQNNYTKLKHSSREWKLWSRIKLIQIVWTPIRLLGKISFPDNRSHPTTTATTTLLSPYLYLQSSLEHSGKQLWACLHGDGGPQVGEATRLAVVKK